jgi:predicted nucleic acid-binding protein
MPSSEQRSYWDSDVFLAYINGEAARLPDVSALLAEAERGEREIVTSTYTVTEAAYAAQEKVNRALDPEELHKIDALWRPPSGVLLAEFHLGVAELARDLMRQAVENGWRRLKPGDAIHLATAVDLGIGVLHTYNVNDFKQSAGPLSIEVSEPKADQLELS